MNKVLAIVCFILGVAIPIFAFPEGGIAVLATLIFAVIGISIIRSLFPDDKEFLVQIFLIGLIARVGFGLIVHIFNLRDFFGGDAVTYDLLAQKLIEVWFYSAEPNEIFTAKDIGRLNGIGWGMPYLLAILYSIFGRNILAAQFVYAVVGAGIAPLIYICSQMIFKNRRVATYASVFVAIYPSFIIWTGQLLKDGIIIFLLVLVMISLLHLQKKFSLPILFLLIFGLFGIVSLRFYIFFMMIVAIIGTFLISGNDTNNNNILRNIIILAVLGLSLTYLGVVRYAGDEFEKYGSLEVVQRSRDDAATRSSSGFGEDLDVSTTQGALTALPIGLIYLMLAPFPWQIVNFRQAITLPDMLIWWGSIPFMISGLFYSVKNRLRGTLGIIIFTLMLSLVYALFQGNVGTAYRQRTQIQVFLFIFVGVGITMHLERKENKRLKLIASNLETERKIRQRRILNNQTQEITDEKQNNLDIQSTEKPTDIITKSDPPNEVEVISKPTAIVEAEEESEPKNNNQENKPSATKPKRIIFRATKKQIKEVQDIFLKEKIYSGKATGKFNQEFRSAIKKYQAQQGLKKTGTLNKITLETIGIKLNKKQKAK